MSALFHDRAYGDLSPEEQDALYDHDVLLAGQDRRAEHSGIEVVPARVRRRYLPPAPAGTCACGCGRVPKIAAKTHTAMGYVKGQPRTFMKGHCLPLPLEWYEEDRGHSTPCWIWARGTNGKGYAQIGVAGVSQYAHRISYETFVGPIPDGLVIDHLCRVRACVNPAHLEPVTTKVNTERGVSCRLSDSDVATIRSLTDPAEVVATRFGITAPYVRDIRSGRRRQHGREAAQELAAQNALRPLTGNVLVLPR